MLSRASKSVKLCFQVTSEEGRLVSACKKLSSAESTDPSQPRISRHHLAIDVFEMRHG
jgi:hypothetical protein